MKSINIQISERQLAQKHRRTHVPVNCVEIPILRTEPSCATPSILLTNACQSWLSNDIPTTAISLQDNYNTYRKDQVNRYGGGVVASKKTDLKSKPLLNLEDEKREVLWLKLFPKRIPRPCSCIVVAGVYSPPGKSITEGKEL